MSRPRARTARTAGNVQRAGGLAGLILGLASSGVAALLITLMGAVILPPLMGPMQAAGAALPWLTRAFAGGYLLVWLGPLLVVLAWRFGGPLRGVVATLIGLAPMLLGGAFAVLAMYLAVFAQAAAI
ncbi:hypothetical protein [Stenotrophomonas sp.]|uniref:hypothetical protein n=1 Tax=Stenotrophomonas sp. TaxID=69392 RepID=UPI002FC8AB8B